MIGTTQVSTMRTLFNAIEKEKVKSRGGIVGDSILYTPENYITVFFLISAPGAFEIRKWHCHFTLQLAPPFNLKICSHLVVFPMNASWNFRISRKSNIKRYFLRKHCKKALKKKTLKKTKSLYAQLIFAS